MLLLLFLGSVHAFNRVHGPLRTLIEKHFNNSQRLSEQNLSVSWLFFEIRSLSNIVYE